MKQKKEKKLHLSKITIQNLDYNLDRDEQKKIRGGSKPSGTTEIIVFC
ncbi:MAG: hypothetical protein GTO45_00390 [Candidatus Aminicenantes bacterium]|nr:hypothetical protein [Candidatus Aminicenantes bacterium]NIM77223.1 hypothetical protein [Candidatus Aminicenantes bacterium]NIN16519.1 hypothetical protein [Candidatus Aminicenantes bacterium]NIN40379.1 hypothetical protein [Candidatus Aminicenantes bacterium]NIN83199.1 hypothetical protein [Candidatus Aminicenantes bacterium]